MKNKLLLYAAIAFCAIASAGRAYAQLFPVSGSFQGIFISTTGGPSILNTNGTSPPTTNLTPGTGGKFLTTTAVFDSSVTSGDSRISFFGGTFTNLTIPVDPGAVLNPVGIPVGVPGFNVDFNIFNGNEHGNTSAKFELFASFTAPVVTLVDLGQITFNLAAPGDISYTESAVMVPTFNLGGSTIKFALDINKSYTILNGATKNFDDTASFSLVAVPEPSTYALWGAAALVGIVAVRRYKASTPGPTMPA